MNWNCKRIAQEHVKLFGEVSYHIERLVEIIAWDRVINEYLKIKTNCSRLEENGQEEKVIISQIDTYKITLQFVLRSSFKHSF